LVLLYGIPFSLATNPIEVFQKKATTLWAHGAAVSGLEVQFVAE